MIAESSFRALSSGHPVRTIRCAVSLPIPNWAPDLAAEGWVNIHAILSKPPRLYGVDALMGDVSAHTLVLGKDAAPARVFIQLRDRGDPDPYRHDPHLPTNLMLHSVLDELRIAAPLDGSRARDCGLYYANAHYLLRADNRFSGALPNRVEAASQSKRMLQYLLASLPKLRRVIAMGADAYSAVTAHYGIDANWRENLVARQPVVADGRSIHATSHMGYFGTRMRSPGATKAERRRIIVEDWRAAFDA